MRIKIVLAKLAFRRDEGFEMQQGAAIKLCVKFMETLVLILE
jgi:hypothetical protein